MVQLSGAIASLIGDVEWRRRRVEIWVESTAQQAVAPPSLSPLRQASLDVSGGWVVDDLATTSTTGLYYRVCARWQPPGATSVAASASAWFALEADTDLEAIEPVDLTILAHGADVTLGHLRAASIGFTGGAGPVHLVGTGTPSPEAQALPVGSTWTDTNQTAGALQWHKIAVGLGLDKWRVVGDTGWRRLTPPTGWALPAGAAGSYDVRRIDGRGYFRCGLHPAGATIGTGRPLAILSLLDLAPLLGFHPSDIDYGHRGSGGRADNSNSWNLFAAADYRIITAYPTVESGVWSGADILCATAEWMILGAWPTTLPGTPV